MEIKEINLEYEVNNQKQFENANENYKYKIFKKETENAKALLMNKEEIIYNLRR